jgi:hypothetical protein
MLDIVNWIILKLLNLVMIAVPLALIWGAVKLVKAFTAIPEEKQGGEDAVEAGADPTGEISVAENPAKSIPPVRNNLFSRIAIPFIMGILGMMSGIFASNTVLSDAGDSPSLGIGIGMMGILSGLTAAVAGNAVADVALRKPRIPVKGRIIGQGIVIVVLSFLTFSCWNEISGFSVEQYDRGAQSTLKNYRSTLEAHFSDCGSYSMAWKKLGQIPSDETVTSPRRPGVVVTPSKLGKEDFVLVAHHVKGKREYMTSSDSLDIFYRVRNSGKEWSKRQ